MKSDVGRNSYFKKALQATLQQEKQRQERAPRQVVFEASPFLCPIDALQRCLPYAPQGSPLFPKYNLRAAEPDAQMPTEGVHRNEVTSLLRRRLKEIGLKEVGGCSAHSLRHSFEKCAGDKGLPQNVIMSLGDWNCVESVRRYLENSSNGNALQRA